jgi:hypothetical protein
MFLASQLVVTVADNKFDIGRGCVIDSTSAYDLKLNETIKRCVSDEQQARIKSNGPVSPALTGPCVDGRRLDSAELC